MSSFKRLCLVIVVSLAACGSKRAAETGSKVEGCDPSHDPTPAAAYKQYLAEGGAPVDYPHLVRVMYDKTPTDRFDVIYHPGPDQPIPSLGTIYKCTLYRDDAKLARAMVLDASWATADAAARKRIALDTDWIAFGSGLNLYPQNWDADYTFHAPELTVLADGGIRIIEWRNHLEMTSYLGDTHLDSYVRESRVFAADGSVSAARTLASFTAAPSKRADFRSGSLR
jgi:hypothetical protein